MCRVIWNGIYKQKKSIVKGKSLMRGFKLMKKYLTEQQFLSIVANTFYSSVFYGGSVWYSLTKQKFKSKFNSLYFRLLRMVCNDHRKLIPKDILRKRCQRASPDEWSHYTTGSKIIKIMRDKEPAYLYDKLSAQYFEEPRKPGIGNFSDASATWVEHQSIENRLDFIRSIKSPWNKNLSDAEIRIILKNSYFIYWHL